MENLINNNSGFSAGLTGLTANGLSSSSLSEGRPSLAEVLDGEGEENLGKDEFLKLLTVQLSHQDPLKPMSNTEFISQMAEFSALEQMKNMNTTVAGLKGEFSKLSNMALIGKTVSFNDLSGELKTGLVEKVSLGGETENQTQVTIEGRSIDLDKITSVLSGENLKEKASAYEKNLSTKKIN